MHLLERQLTSLYPIRKRRSFNEREDQPTRVFGVHDSAFMPDIGMIERGQNLGFPLEASHAVAIAQERRGQNFQCYVTLKRCVACAVDFAHSARTDWRKDFVGAEFVTRRKRHVSESVKFSRLGSS